VVYQQNTALFAREAIRHFIGTKTQNQEIFGFIARAFVSEVTLYDSIVT
jgi:hypothetical protein